MIRNEAKLLEKMFRNKTNRDGPIPKSGIEANFNNTINY